MQGHDAIQNVCISYYHDRDRYTRREGVSGFSGTLLGKIHYDSENEDMEINYDLNFRL